MTYILTWLDMMMHLDVHLQAVIQNFGIYTYLLLFVIIFCETGLVVTPFLPGDSLLFISGTLAAAGLLDIKSLFIIIFIAAVLGDTINYQIGYFVGPKVFDSKKFKFINRSHLNKTKRYYNKYGMQVIILSRFIPIIRTFAPFVAGVSKMRYKYFIIYNIIGGFIWTVLLLLGGYFFGNISIVKDNYTLVTILIVFVSVLPAVVGFMRQKQDEEHQE